MNDTANPTICVCAPARTCVCGEGLDEVDVERIEASEAALRAMGWLVREAANVRELDHGFAGGDAARAEGLMAGFLDPEVDLVLPIRGGYGTARILPLLDWDAIGASGAVFAGLSDLTAFNLALYARCARASWQGPVAHAFARANADFDARFARAMSEPRFSFSSPARRHDAGKAPDAPFSAQGLFWGGNLTILLSLMATPWLPRIEGGILFVEDVHVTAWRFERMLVQLAQSGILGRQRALVVGDVTGHEAGLKGPNSGIALSDALAYAGRISGVPVFSGLPFGHRPDTMTLPVGCPGRIEFADGVLTLEVEHPPVPAETPGQPAFRGPQWWV